MDRIGWLLGIWQTMHRLTDGPFIYLFFSFFFFFFFFFFCILLLWTVFFSLIFFLSLTLSLSLYLFHNGENELLFFASFFNDIQRTGASASERGWFLLHFNYGNTWWSGWSQFHRQQLIRARSVCDAAQKKRIQGINSRQLHVWYLKARRIWTSRNCKL